MNINGFLPFLASLVLLATPLCAATSADAPVILTPKPAATPRINGPMIFGVRPGSPFLYAIPATGDRPMTFSAKGLPAGLRLDATTGRITGTLNQKGEFAVTLLARNALGTAEKKFRIVVGDQIALTPPMGWNSWNCWAGAVSQDKVLRSARALVTSGLSQHGWSYVNIDDAWQGRRGGPLNAIQPNEKFPDMKALCDEIHALGLKAGIYSTPWVTTYDRHVGGSSLNPEGTWTEADSKGKTTGGKLPFALGKYFFVRSDVRQWADWGFDYLKYDWAPVSVRETREMSEALRASGRDIVFSLSNNGDGAVFPIVGDLSSLANSWRTTNDINDRWSWVQQIGFSQDKWAPRAGPGHWNDPDMLVVGHVGWGKPHPTKLTPDEQYTHISLWCLLSSPLLIGCDLEKLDDFTLGLLTNDEVLDVNQDALGKQATQISRDGDKVVYAKMLEDGSVAVGLFNLGPVEANVAITWGPSGSWPTATADKQLVRDLWRQKDLGVHQGKFETNVPSHGVVLVRLTAIDSLTMAMLPAPVAEPASRVQTVQLDGKAGGPRFDGIGVVNGGGATSVLLKDYPEPQRSQILHLVYKPKFGASVSALLVEIPGDGNSTQGAMPSHMHTRDDLDYTRGYMWWILREAKKRNPNLSLDGAAWSSPGWVGNGNFWSQDAADYYVKWLQGLRSVYGLEFDALGCRNEKGVSFDFAKKLRASLDAQGFDQVKIHAFDDWPKSKLDFVKQLSGDESLRKAIDIISAHTMNSKRAGQWPASPEVQRLAAKMGKPIWNTEEHVYLPGFACALRIVQAFNDNFITSGATRVVNWYDIAGLYPMEPYSETPAAVLAHSPWSGHYEVREALWGYAHYGQFTEVGWHYLAGGSGALAVGGSFVTLKAPTGGDYSIIFETADAKAPQTVRFQTSALSAKPLCVWRSDEKEQFVQQPGIKPEGGAFTITLEPNAIYSLSTTTGQQKGSFTAIPAAKPFPFPYYETFEEYTTPKDWGSLPHYTADIYGAFEIADRPGETGKCLRQVVPVRTISWAPDWLPYTILGDDQWQDYEVSSDVRLNAGDSAGVMGRINHVGTGYGFIPKGYFLQLSSDGECRLVVIRGKKDKKKATGDAEQQALIKAGKDEGEGGEKVLGTVHVSGIGPGQWHNLKLRLEGASITALVDDKPILNATDTLYSHGMAGLLAGGGEQKKLSTPWFDNLLIKAVNAPTPKPTPPAPGQSPIYGETTLAK